MANSETTEHHDEADAPKGALDQTSVPQLLAHAWRDKKSGCLSLTMGQAVRRIQVRDGSPIGVELFGDNDEFAQKLEDDGLIQPADRLKVQRHAQEKKTSQAAAVLALRLLDAKTLYQTIRASTRNQIAESFEWQSGEYEWTTVPEQENASAKPLDILELIQQQLPRRWGADRLFASLMSSSSSYAEIAPRFRLVAKKLATAGDQASQTIARLDGSVSLGQILGECAGNKESAATLWTLVEAGILRLSEERLSRTATTEEIQFEVEIESTASAGRAKGATKSSFSASSARSKADAKSEDLKTEIESLIKQLPDLDHYNALGLNASATPTEVKRAYFKAAKKFHPDALTRLDLTNLREDAGRVFARIAEAFETLSDETKKAAYDAGDGEETEIDTARLAQAETSFRKGEILVRMGNFEGALEYLEPAVALWPDEPAYQAELGWALYKQPRSEAGRAREHLETAQRQSPDEAIILFRLGFVLRVLGEEKDGDAMMERARRLDPSIEE